jgi:hypothetical protein
LDNRIWQCKCKTDAKSALPESALHGKAISPVFSLKLSLICSNASTHQIERKEQNGEETKIAPITITKPAPI